METYEAIYSRMKEKYTELTGIVPSAQSDISIRLSVLAGEIYNASVNMEWIKRQMYSDSAQGEWLDYHARLRGLERHKAGVSTADCLFSCETPATEDILIPKGTIVAVKGEEELCFETLEDEVIYKDTLSNHVMVRALEEGRKYNVAANTITEFITPLSASLSVTNPDPSEGGADVESDESLRERIRETFKFPSNGTNASYYKSLATSVEGVTSAAVVPKGRGAGTVDVYVAAEGAEVSDETLTQVQKILSEKREINVDVLALKATPIDICYNLRIVVEDGYDFHKVREECITNIEDYINSCPVGARVLMTETGERVYHTEGVKEYAFVGVNNMDIPCKPSEFPLVGGITIEEGSVI